MLIAGGVERAAEDARGAARPRRVRAGHHRPAEGAAHHPQPHPALRVPPAAAPTSSPSTCAWVIARRRARRRRRRRRLRGPPGRRLGPRHAVRARPGGRGRRACSTTARRSTTWSTPWPTRDAGQALRRRSPTPSAPGASPACSARRCSARLRDVFLAADGRAARPPARPAELDRVAGLGRPARRPGHHPGARGGRRRAARDAPGARPAHPPRGRARAGSPGPTRDASLDALLARVDRTRAAAARRRRRPAAAARRAAAAGRVPPPLRRPRRPRRPAPAARRRPAAAPRPRTARRRRRPRRRPAAGRPPRPAPARGAAADRRQGRRTRPARPAGRRPPPAAGPPDPPPPPPAADAPPAAARAPRPPRRPRAAAAAAAPRTPAARLARPRRRAPEPGAAAAGAATRPAGPSTGASWTDRCSRRSPGSPRRCYQTADLVASRASTAVSAVANDHHRQKCERKRADVERGAGRRTSAGRCRSPRGRRGRRGDGGAAAAGRRAAAARRRRPRRATSPSPTSTTSTTRRDAPTGGLAALTEAFPGAELLEET